MREPAAQDLIGGRYLLQAPLGEGGMGSVWEATHTVTRRRHALKFLKAHLGQREDLRRRFAREARAASMARHPNVVDVQDLFELEDGTLVMSMELLEGRTLGALMREAGPLSLATIASHLVPAISAVGTAHALGIVHRDLKPENIFLVGPADAPEVRVLDFGIAKLVDPGSTLGITHTGALLGTPCYMSPEQALGEGTADHRTDIWSFGVILYEALAGARPVEGENIGQVLGRLLNDGIMPIEVIVPELPEDVSDLIGRMLSQDRDDRPEDLMQVMTVVERHTTVRAPTFGPPRAKPLEELPVIDGPRHSVADALADTFAQAPVPAPRPRRTWLAFAAAGALFAAIAGAWFTGGEDPPRAALTAAAAQAERLPVSDVAAHAARASVPEARPAGPPPPEPTRAPSAMARPRLRPLAPPPKMAMPAEKSVAQTTVNGPSIGRLPARSAQDGLVDDPPF